MKNIIIVILFVFAHFASAAQVSLKDHEGAIDLFLKEHTSDGRVDYQAIYEQQSVINTIIANIANADLSNTSPEDKVAFYINAYNIIVIQQVAASYPLASVKEIGGFFDRKKHQVAGRNLTLNEIEKDILLKEYHDPRYHFVLICGAVDCPKIFAGAVLPHKLDIQLEARTRAAVNDASFIRQSGPNYEISEIFKWYQSDFGGSKSSAVSFINQYRSEAIPDASDVGYYKYDWTINGIEQVANKNNNAYRYVTSAAIPQGGMEIKLFNNLYTQNDGRRTTYLTSTFSALYGLNNRFNIGLTGRYRRVLEDEQLRSPLQVFSSLSLPNGRQGITAIGPQIRWAPIRKWEGFSIQSSFTIPIGSQLTGTDSSPFIDWDGPTFVTQFFNDRSIGDQFSLFTEIDLWVEDIGGSGFANRVSTPITAILSWFPQKNITVYGLAGYAPFLARPYDYFAQFGLGIKYQLSPQFEVEILATDFSNRYLNSVDGSASTWNIGFRYSR